MVKISYNRDHRNVIDAILLDLPGVTQGKMFGYPAYYVNRKMFACLYENGIGLKLPEDYTRQLLEQGTAFPFQPLGRKKMRRWVQIDHERSEDYLEDTEILKRALEYVASPAKK